jgi:hypothetical protein
VKIRLKKHRESVQRAVAAKANYQTMHIDLNAQMFQIIQNVDYTTDSAGHFLLLLFVYFTETEATFRLFPKDMYSNLSYV